MMSYFLYSLCWFAVTSASPTVNVTDFDDFFRGYEFIYHDQTDLMIAIQGDSCYFIGSNDAKEASLVSDADSGFFGSPLENTQLLIITHIEAGQVKASTLQEMRDSYQDRLADFHCLNKHVFRILPAGTLTTTTPTTGTPTTMKPARPPTTLTTTTTVKPCEDVYLGDCNTDFAGRCDSSFVSTVCQKYCNMCPTTTPTTMKLARPPTALTTTVKPCEDVYLGDCNADFGLGCSPMVSAICQKSCNTC